jgi:cytidine deaminase
MEPLLMISDDQIEQLLAAARVASQQAYCPYSHFSVGAALLTSTGRVVAGCNVENASYGLTICAERNAIFQAVAAGERHIQAMAIYTPTATPTAPCGACRQVLFEFGPDATIVSVCDGPGILKAKVGDLLPAAFG